VSNLRARFAASSIVLLALLAACASPAPRPLTQTTGPRTYRENIDISGRFSAQFQRNGKPESWSGGFDWSQSPQLTTVTLHSPLGQTLATIVVDPDSATLTQSGRAPRRAADVDSLAQDTLGWPLPVSNLRNWLQGYAKGADGQMIAATPQATAVITTPDGWHIRYISWQENNEYAGQDVPKRIDMERETVEAGQVQMRLVISNWQVH